MAGFRASQIHPVERQLNSRHQGQRLYLSSALMGLKCFVLGGTIAYLLHSLLPDQFQFLCWTIHTTFANYLTSIFVQTGAATPNDALQWAWFVILGAASWFAGDVIRGCAHLYLMIYYRTWRTKWMMMNDILSESPLDHRLYIAQWERMPVFLTMANRKVYVGYVLECAEPVQSAGARQEIVLLPLMSGYRDEQTLEVTITNYHHKDSEEELNVILGQSEIVSSGEFNWTAFDDMQKKTANRKK